jgi:hypothetical protein
MMLGFIGVLASLCLVVALNWDRFNALGAPAVTRMLVAWTGIILALVLIVKLLGY